MSARDEDIIVLAERAMAADIVSEHGYVGATRLALRLLEHVVGRIQPSDSRAAWHAAVVARVGELALFITRLDAAGLVERPPRRARAEA